MFLADPSKLIIRPIDLPIGPQPSRIDDSGIVIRRYHHEYTVNRPQATITLYPRAGIALIEGSTFRCYSCDVTWHKSAGGTCWNCGESRRLASVFPGETYSGD